MKRRTTAAAALAAGALLVTLSDVPADAVRIDDTGSTGCFDPHSVGAGARTGTPSRAPDHVAVSPQQQRSIDRRTQHILAARPDKVQHRRTGADVPVYVHVMRDASGAGNATRDQINEQIDVLNTDFAGAESLTAADSGFTFTLAGIDRYKNDAWHLGHQSKTFRRATRLGGADALNIWLVDFADLGVATFPWDYAAHPRLDGIRVNVGSLPGGPIADYDLGKSATHETGHWLGLYHTFQGGCTATNDSVADTPAQNGPTSGCPKSRDSCALPGLDPIHNYMDYSFDACYSEFTPEQATRMQDMFTAYRT